ncbi:MAG: rhomboid family intramembrane serine protease [Polyangiaceae bacterium]|nr:rhomboid family intramembrane serine protease [Polyangiaceae bacterium]
MAERAPVVPAKPRTLPPIAREVKAQAMILGSLVGLMWVLEIVDQVAFGEGMDALGVHPRSLRGLYGIVFAPFLHVGFAHLVANTVPLVVLGIFIMLRRKRDLLYVSLAAALVGGVGVWLVGASHSVHLGASVLVFGYLGYMLSRGIFERSFWPIVGSLVVGLLYGGAIFGVLPGQPGISWEGHLFGFAGGVLAAWVLTQQAKVAARAKVGAAGAAVRRPAR